MVSLIKRLSKLHDHLPAWLQIVIAAISRSMARDVMLFAGGVSFFGMLALFPAIALGISAYGLAFSTAEAETQIGRFAEIMPPGAQDFVMGQIGRITEAPISALSLNGAIALMIALFAAARGAKALIAGLNHLAEDRDIRNVIHFNLLAVLSVLIGGVLITAANLAVLIIPVIMRQLFELLGLDPLDFRSVVNEWSATGLTMLAALTLLYRMTMRRREYAIGWRASAIAALVSCVLWLALSKGFSLYVGEVVDFDIYGSLGALVVFLLWIYWSAYAVFFGGALAIEIDARRPGPTSPDDPREPA
tara:strand:+ start:29384 stop:30295 length:912 start_codon:yes stop_codon:yes gene_type:complete